MTQIKHSPINPGWFIPIIENYIKSILSTHTVLFLGYSYSDYNLKQIIKWQQYHSDVQPPRYLVQFSDNVSQTKYLQAHGITTLTLEGTQESHTSRLIEFLKKLNNNPRSYLLNYQSNPEIFILEKLTIFSGLDRILFEQIQKSLTNCKFLYDNNDVILQFFIDEMSFNYDPVIRKIYQKFVTNLAKKNLDERADFSPATTEIFDILSRANIKGIAISTSEKAEYIPIEKDTRSERMYFNFDIQHSEECVISSNEVIWDLMHLAFACYQIQEYEKAYKLTEEAISKSRKERMYVYLFIAMYNRNHLLRCLQVDPLTHEKFSDIEYYDLEEMYLNLPQDIRAVAKPIHDFVNFSLLHKFLFDTSVDLKNKEEASKQLKHGGFSFSANADKTACRQKNLLSFVLANAIMIEEYQDFKHFNQQAVEIALMKQSHCEQFSLTRVELFSAIKYIEFKYFKKLLNSQYAGETNRAFSILEEDKKWLIDMVIPQNLKMFHQAIGLKKSKSSNHLQKAIYVLSLLPLDKDEINTTLSHLHNLAEETQLLLREKFQRLTGFLIKNQEILYPKSIKKEALIEIIIGHLQGLVNNSNELRGLQDNGYADVYYCASQRKLKIDNQEIVNALLEMVSQYTIFEQTMISRGLLFSLAEVCDDMPKKRIFDFILGIPLKELNEGSFLLYSLDLEIYELRQMGEDFVKQLEIYMAKQEGGKSLGSNLHDFNRKLNYLYNERKLKKYKKSSEIAIRLSNKMNEMMRSFSSF